MPVFDSKSLLTQLEEDTRKILNHVNELMANPAVQWSRQPFEYKWSPVQVIEHLNSYNRYYLPQLGKALDRGKGMGATNHAAFKSGWLGNYFTKIMLPAQDGKIVNKMNAPKDHSPKNDLNVEVVLQEFVIGQQRLLAYLKDAHNTDLARLKVPISISRYLKLKLGDTFRFLIAHQQRHIIQLDFALNNYI